jgi:glutamate-1-semialdehyde 2,1-aminomutase
LVQAGSGLATLGTSSSAGVPEVFAGETIVLPLNDEEAVKKVFEEYKEEIAAIIIEPIPANNGLLLQRKEYLEFLIEIAHENCSLVIFDEVINGFRVGRYGAAGHYDLKPDIITYGKIIGGGMPVGAFAAKQGIMSYMAPEGPVYQAGTLSGNPVAMAAGAAQLSICFEDGFYDRLAKNTETFAGIINDKLNAASVNAEVITVGSIFWIKLTKETIRSADQIDPACMEVFKEMYDILLEKGVYIGPSGYEVGFISDAHTDVQINSAANIIADALIASMK